MIGYVRVDTDDLSRAAAFHGALLAEMGARRPKQGVCVVKPLGEQPATPGNGTMIALAID